MSQHVIELNGKKYDAITGAQLGKGKVIDGFIRQAPKTPAKTLPDTPAPKAHTPPKAPSTPKAAPPPKVADIKPPAKQSAHSSRPHAMRRPEHAKTLMRSSVKRPQASLKPAIKTQAPAEMHVQHTATTLARKQSAAQVNPSRMKRAVSIPKHHAITRFHHQGTPLFAPAVVPLSASVPVIAVKPVPASGRRAESAGLRSSIPATAGHPHNVHSHKDIKPLHSNIFEQALHQANSHTQPAHKPRKKSRRLANTMAGIAAFLVIAGFIGYLNLPTLELHVASLQAGFSASMPSYRPTGYALAGGVKRSGGTVSMHFRSGASMYTITQQASDWNSQTLLDNTLALGGTHETVQRNGQTIYIYGEGTNAAWVSGGVRYDLTTNAELNKQDIVSIATSM